MSKHSNKRKQFYFFLAKQEKELHEKEELSSCILLNEERMIKAWLWAFFLHCLFTVMISK